jgi:hypothetical protein
MAKSPLQEMPRRIRTRQTDRDYQDHYIDAHERKGQRPWYGLRNWDNGEIHDTPDEEAINDRIDE